MTLFEIILRILVVVLSVSLIITVVIFKIKYNSILINLYNLSKGMDELYSNQNKILELTNIKNYVQLVNEDARKVKNQIIDEKQKITVVADTNDENVV